MIVNARALLIERKTLGTDPLVDTIITKPESTEAILYASALALNKSNLKRQYIEASLLASSDTEAISAILEIPQPVLDMYGLVFYEVANLDKLSKMELMSEGTKEERLFKLWAISQGLDFIAWRLGKPVFVSPVDGLQDLFTTCMYKAKEAMFNSNATEASKESTKYVKLAMDIARLLKVWVLDSSAAKQDIEMALRTINPNFKGMDELFAEEDAKDNAGKTEEEDSILSGAVPAEGVEIPTEISIEDLLRQNDDKQVPD